MKILFVEPDQYYHENFSTIFGSLGDLRFVGSVTEGLQAVQEMKPDALVMELNLPDFPGYDLLKQIRALDLFSILPVIIFSEVSHPEDINATLDLGVIAYMVKGRNQLHEIHQLLLTINDLNPRAITEFSEDSSQVWDHRRRL